MVRGGGSNGSSNHKGLIIDGQKCGPECQRQLDERKSSNGSPRNWSSKVARKLRVIYSIEPEDTEFKETMKNARKELELPMEAAMHCKVKNYQGMEPCGK